MKAWKRSVRRMLGLTGAGLLIALGVAVVRGQTETPGYGEPPAVDAPTPEQSSESPSPPFTPPSPTPLPPDQLAPFVPTSPSPLAPGQEPPMPMVRLSVRAPAEIEPDKEIEYRISVQNVSSADAHHVLVRDRLPSGVEKDLRAKPEPTRRTEVKEKDATDLLWELGTLKAGVTKEIVLTIKPQGNKDIENRAYVQFEHGQKVTTRVAKPGVRVKVTVPPQTILFESIPLRIEVANTGSVPLRNVVVTDELPAGLELVEGKPEPSTEKPLTWKLGEILPRQTKRLECQVISKQAGTFRNNVSVKGDGDASATDSAAVTVGKAELKISTSGPVRRLANRPIPYHITIRNVGTMPVTNVQVADELPRGIEFVSASAEGRKEGGFVRWSFGTLPAGEQRSLLLVLRAPAAGWCWDQATVRADNNLSDKAHSDWTRIETANAPVIEIDKNKDWLLVGEKARYTIRLYNPGINNTLSPSVSLTVSDELGIVRQSGPTTGQQQGQNIHFDRLPVLNRGEEAVYYVEVEAKKPGAAKLRACWADGRMQETPPESWEDITTILESPQSASGVASASRETKSRR